MQEICGTAAELTSIMITYTIISQSISQPLEDTTPRRRLYRFFLQKKEKKHIYVDQSDLLHLLFWHSNIIIYSEHSVLSI